MSDAKTKVISFENIKLIDLLDSALKYKFRYERFDFCPVDYKKKTELTYYSEENM
jgi:hypothetical protein